jgi:hypothetical protein
MTAILAVNALSVNVTVALLAGVGYIVFILLAVRASLRERGERDLIERGTIAALFKFMNDRLFSGSSNTRFTFFVPNGQVQRQGRVTEDCIRPLVRYQVGGSDAIRDAEVSRAVYVKGEGITGFAWKHPRDTVHIKEFPAFGTRREMEQFYVHQMEVSESVVGLLSAYMNDVRGILAYGFVDHADQLLGVLSLDFRNPLEEVELDSDRIEEMIVLVQGVLQTFASAE